MPLETLRPVVAWRPLESSRLPEKELEPVLVLVMRPAKDKVPEMEAVPPTSRVVSVALPALIPSRELAEVNSREPEPEALMKLN